MYVHGISESVVVVTACTTRRAADFATVDINLLS
jgi:hypothetical protein